MSSKRSIGCSYDPNELRKADGADFLSKPCHGETGYEYTSSRLFRGQFRAFLSKTGQSGVLIVEKFALSFPTS